MNDDNALTFEKVSIAEARAAHKGLSNKSKEDANWTEKRQPAISSDLEMQKETESWLLGLPERVRPVHLAKQFPRLANRICSAWKRPEVCIKVFDDLMTDARGTRKGFPMEVARDITNLRVYYTTEVFKMKQDTWVLNP